MSNNESEKTGVLISFYNRLQSHFESIVKDEETNQELYHQFQKWEEALKKQHPDAGSFQMPVFQQKFTEYVNSKEGKIVIENVVAAVQKETNKSGNSFAADYDYQKLISKILSGMEDQKIMEEERNSSQRNDRINKEVKNSISEATKNIKSWQGLSSD